jgi:glycine/D-amino acid oxidase-like deaminating enzyme
MLVNAAGPWARDVAALAGVDLPVEARRRCVFAFDARRRIDDCPLVIDTSGAWFRPEGELFIAATSPSDGEDRDGLPLEVDHRQWEEALWPALAARVPAFDAVKVTNAWAGYYDYNTFDQNAILGPHPELENLLFANGFSGHGIQQAPAVGRAIAEVIVHGRYVSLDLSVFGFERIAAGRRVVERNVIG